MKQVTEKTHRVLRVIEKKGSTSLIPLYWQWLQKTRIPQYTREGIDGEGTKETPRICSPVGHD